MTENSTYRIRTELNQTNPTVLNVHLDQTYDSLEILTLKLDQTNSYKLFESGFGVICGRVTCSGFGIPNAKIGVFIQVDDNATVKERLIYNYSSTSETNNDGVVYNLLPNFVDNKCHQDVGTFPSKREWLDSNETTVQIYEDYYQFTTTSGPCGDFMIICPSGNAILHCDVDLSDIGTYLSQRPLDMEAKGYSATQFDSPNKFKKSTNLRELSQLYSQDKGLYVYPYWGEQNEFGDNIAITRCDYDISYSFTPTAIFMGSVVTDKGNNGFNQKCKPAKNIGKMSELAATSGTINMVRKTPSGKVEQFQILGDQLIDDDGVWCYQIPMNLDYVKMDEFGNIVPTDDVENGLPTRARVRFKFTLNETTEDTDAWKRCSYLVPNNPRLDDDHYPKFTELLEPDYEFGSLTNDESFKDLFWNNVYTVKSYIPKLQTSHKTNSRNHTGIKWTSFFEGNNPFPFNSMVIKKSISFSALCTLVKFIKDIVTFLNQILTILGAVPCLILSFLKSLVDFSIDFYLFKIPLGKLLGFFLNPLIDLVSYLVPPCIKLGSEFCDDGVSNTVYVPGCGKFPFSGMDLPDWLGGCVYGNAVQRIQNGEYEEADSVEEYEANASFVTNSSSGLVTCFENQLAQDNEIVSFNFTNDWINGCLYFPVWYRRIRPKKAYLFGLWHGSHKNDWCKYSENFDKFRVQQGCSINYYSKDKNGKTHEYKNYVGKEITPYYYVTSSDSTRYHEKYQQRKGLNGIIFDKETMLGDTVYYYVPVTYDSGLAHNDYANADKNGEVLLLFATDIVLLGNIQECNMYGIPQFFEHLPSTTYNLPNDILDLDTDATATVDDNGNLVTTIFDRTSTETGCDWGNVGADQCGDKDDGDGGLFYGIGCSTIDVMKKSCINLLRICEFGVAKDTIQTIDNLQELSGNANAEGDELTPDGFVSYDELYNYDQRAMFATMNSNNLFVKYNNKNGFYEYDLHYLYPNNFDGSLYQLMFDRQAIQCSANYKDNYNLETFSQDYYNFRMGEAPYFYITDNSSGYGTFPRYENSFYFYFGLTEGKTAINKFRDNYYAPCEDLSGEVNAISVVAQANNWCSEVTTSNEDKDGYIEVDATNIETPYSISLKSTSNLSVEFEIDDLTDEKVIICEKSVFTKLSEEVDNFSYSCPGVCQFNVPNGDYEMTITDANGETVSLTFTMKAKYLNYQVESLDFTVGNETLRNSLGSYGDVANYKEHCNTDETTEDDDNDTGFEYRCQTGGVLKIENVFYDNEYLQNFKLTVFSDDFSDYDPPYVIVKNGSVDKYGGDGVLSENANGDSGNPIYIGLPYGGVFYTVEITQQCYQNGINGAIDSNNTIKQEVYVEKAIDLKLYINDIDFDLISWWDPLVTDCGGLGTYSSDNSKGWLKLSDVSQYQWENCDEATTLLNTIMNTLVGRNYVTILPSQATCGCETSAPPGLNIDSSFRDTLRSALFGSGWPFTSDSSKEDILSLFEDNLRICICVDGSILTEEEKDSIEDSIYTAIKDFQTFIDTTIANVKSAFVMTCSDNTKTLSLTAKTTNVNYPLTYAVWGREEATDEDTHEQHLADQQTAPIYMGNISTISDIGVPTISTTDSEKFGNEDSTIIDNICLATDNECEFEDKRKFAYYVAVKDSAGNTLPCNLDLCKFDETTKSCNDIDCGTKGMFVVHFIDKLMESNFISWSCFENMYYFGKDGVDTCPINMNGFVAGLIKNGMISYSNSSIGEVYFSKQTLDGEDVEIYNIKLDGTEHYSGWYEDQFPTERVLNTEIGCKDEEDSKYSCDEECVDKCFGPMNYVVSTTENPNPNISSQCAIVPNKSCNLEITSSDGCYVLVSIYGKKKITIDQPIKIINEGGGITYTINTQISNGGYDEIYYIYNVSDNPYPLNDIVMEYDEDTEDEPIEPCTKISKAYIDMSENDRNKSWDQGGSIFSYATTQEVLLSKVYEKINSTYTTYDDNGLLSSDPTFGWGNSGVFTDIQEGDKVFIVAVDSDECRAISPVYDFTTPSVTLSLKTENDEYYFGITLNSNPSCYYLQTYASKVIIECTAATEVNHIEISADPFSEGGAYYKLLYQSTYNTLRNYQSEHLQPLSTVTTVTITDCIEITHNCTVNG